MYGWTFTALGMDGFFTDHPDHGVAAVASIPEPHQYAMLLAGLGTLGFMRRRRIVPTWLLFGNTMTIRNTTAVWGWLICSAFIFGCAGMSWLLLNERVPDGASPLLMGAFNLALWAVGMFAAHRVLAKPVTILRCHAEGITVDSYWLWKRVRAYHAKDCIRETRIQESADAEGDPYFTASVVLGNGTTILLAEGHFRELCEQAVNRLNEALHNA